LDNFRSYIVELEDDTRRKSTFSSASFTIGLIGVMVTLVVVGFLYIAYLHQELMSLRDDAREMRHTRQAMTTVDRTVLASMSNTGTELPSIAFGRAVNALDSYGIDHLPVRVMLGNEATPSKFALADMKKSWADVVSKLESGQRDAAYAVYEATQIDRSMTAFLTSFSSALDQKEREIAALETHVAITTWLSLLGQIVTGVISILAFLFAARRGARASKAREAAVQGANATREQVMRLFEMTDVLQSANDLADANAVLRSTSVELLPDFGGALYVFNNSRDRLVLSTHWNTKEGEPMAEAISLNQCWALKRGKPHVNRPTSHKLCCEHHHSSYHCLEIPMIARGEILGLLHIYSDGEDAGQRLADIGGIGSALADAMSLALANLALRDKLRSQALRDPLTGLYNRRYMEDTLQRIARLSDRERSDLSVMMIDLDHFKRLNDQYGHAKGDAVLRDAAALIIGQLRESDVACRYGGEELMVILPQCGLEMAATKAEQLRGAIESLSEPNGAQVSASMGVASIPATSTSIRDLMAAADAALYRAKQDGRNRVVCAAPAAIKSTTSEEAEFRSALGTAA
jgi:diguanylate cyclase (GGDEF)-like protein